MLCLGSWTSARLRQRQRSLDNFPFNRNYWCLTCFASFIRYRTHCSSAWHLIASVGCLTNSVFIPPQSLRITPFLFIHPFIAQNYVLPITQREKYSFEVCRNSKNTRFWTLKTWVYTYRYLYEHTYKELRNQGIRLAGIRVAYRCGYLHTWVD